MILYLDTSAFIKLYVNEPGADIIRAAVAEADQPPPPWRTPPKTPLPWPACPVRDEK